jgi:hypothetical protein
MGYLDRLVRYADPGLTARGRQSPDLSVLTGTDSHGITARA